LKDGQNQAADEAGHTAGQTAPELAIALIGETADDPDIALVTSLLDNLRSMGVVTCLAA
jgi:hypothetical protein